MLTRKQIWYKYAKYVPTYNSWSNYITNDTNNNAKKVRFAIRSRVILIPSRQDKYMQDLIPCLWYSFDDIESFKEDFIYEIQSSSENII